MAPAGRLKVARQRDELFVRRGSGDVLAGKGSERLQAGAVGLSSLKGWPHYGHGHIIARGSPTQMCCSATREGDQSARAAYGSRRR
jgi:hypothetical protein